MNRLYIAHTSPAAAGRKSRPFHSKARTDGWNGETHDVAGTSNPSNRSKGVERKGSKIDPPFPRVRARLESGRVGTRRWFE